MNNLKGKLFLAAAFVLAGSSVVSARYLSDTLSPFTITFLSLTFAVVTALVVHGGGMVRAMRTLSRRHWRLLALQAVLGIFLFRVFLTFSLGYTSAAEAGIITGASPAITALLTWMLLREPLRARSVAGIACTLAGMLVLQGFPFQMADFDLGHLAGNLLALCAAACESLFTTLSRKAHLDKEEEFRLAPVAQAGIVSLMAWALCLVPMVLERPLAPVAALEPGGWIALVWYGSVVTVAAFACMFAGAKTCDGYTIAAFTGLIPLSSLLLSILILGERVAPHQWLGCAVIVGGILLMSQRDRG